MSRASRAAIALGEEMADGPIPEGRRQAVLRAAIEAVLRHPEENGDGFFAADRAYRVVCNDGWYAVEWTVGNGPELPGGVAILIDLVGGPTRPASFDPARATPKVIGLARAIYDDRAFDRMPRLGHALADAGCADRAMLDHCHGAGPHVRGCWVVDAVLGKA